MTLFAQVASIVNSRPLTILPDDPNDLRPLSPNDLLLLRPSEPFPCGLFSSDDNYTRRRWRQIQYLAGVFWKRWLKEYLPSLQERQKWLQPKSNLKVDDVVLLIDHSAPKGSWNIGRVCEVIPDSKGLVRTVIVKSKSGLLKRPISKLCLLLEGDSP